MPRPDEITPSKLGELLGSPNRKLAGILPASVLRFPDGILEGGILRFEPAGHGHFLLGVELNSFRALNVQIAEEGIVPTREGEPGHGCRYAHVDADHAGIEVALELSGGTT